MWELCCLDNNVGYLGDTPDVTHLSKGITSDVTVCGCVFTKVNFIVFLCLQ